MSLTGTPEQACRVGVSICDVSTGIYAAVLVLAALRERDDGVGRRLDVAMLDVATEFSAPMLLSFANAGVVYPRLADQHHAIAPYGVFETRRRHRDPDRRPPGRRVAAALRGADRAAGARRRRPLRDDARSRRPSPRRRGLVGEAVGRSDHEEVVEILEAGRHRPRAR